MEFISQNPLSLLLISRLVRSQMVCKQCEKSAKGKCTGEEKCKTLQTRCLSIQWGPKAKENPNTYTMKCATPDDCAEVKRKDLCADKSDCKVGCCDYKNCDPFRKPNEFLEVAERSFRCHRCRSESLDSCLETKQQCDGDQNACISFLMEGGNLGKVYTKRCARKDECLNEERDRLCELEKDQSQRKKCRSSCCFYELCNEAGTKTMSQFAVVFLVTLALALVV